MASLRKRIEEQDQIITQLKNSQNNTSSANMVTGKSRQPIKISDKDKAKFQTEPQIESVEVQLQSNKGSPQRTPAKSPKKATVVPAKRAVPARASVRGKVGTRRSSAGSKKQESVTDVQMFQETGDTESELEDEVRVVRKKGSGPEALVRDKWHRDDPEHYQQFLKNGLKPLMPSQTAEDTPR